MPGLSEVEALKDFLTENLVGHEIVHVPPVVISVLKTYDLPAACPAPARVRSRRASP
jgi:formamidopyrimidine-DNA glycosylase